MLESDLTLRSSDGSVLRRPLFSDRYVDEEEIRIILIHGFLVDEESAKESYDRFRTYLQAYSGRHAQKLFYLIWFGDEVGTNVMRFFANNVQNAEESGNALARHFDTRIRKEGPKCQFVIVAHSLGCRVTAQAMKELFRLNPQACKQFSLFLMAGAVPMRKVEDRNVFGLALAATSRVANLYSPDDGVLNWLYRPGELGGLRWVSEAIGLNGEPKAFNWSECTPMTGFGHRDYWKKVDVPKLVAKALAVPIDTEIPTTVLPTYNPPEHRN